MDSEEKARQVTKSPVFFTNFVLLGLADSVSKCLINSSSLTCLQIERIPLDSKLITVIAEVSTPITKLIMFQHKIADKWEILQLQTFIH